MLLGLSIFVGSSVFGTAVIGAKYALGIPDCTWVQHGFAMKKKGVKAVSKVVFFPISINPVEA